MEPAKPTPRIPLATYRLQFNQHFGFSAAREILPYLHQLGISDIYASPCFAAKKGSLHGYDIVDQRRLNAELGSEEEHAALTREVARLGMGRIVDFVPNHMCIESSDNVWWNDVLENGPSSPYAYFFDLDWEPVKKELNSKVLLPFLGDQYGSVLERGELSLAFQDGAFQLHYYDFTIPIEPTSYRHLLRYRLERLRELLPPDAPPFMELLSIITALQHLPSPTEQDPDRRAERYREKEIIKKRLAALCTAAPPIAAFIEENLASFNGTTGEEASFDLLDALLKDQVYRLAFWKVATEEINYRRFFDINGLAAIRMEDAAVFRETHPLLLRLVREGAVTGIRLDHLDGLYDPASYLRKLQRLCYVQQRLAQHPSPPETPEREAELGAQYGKEFEHLLEGDPGYRPFYIVGEKILLREETTPQDWLIFSTTGYDFANAVNGIFVETAAASSFDHIYARFIGRSMHYPEVMYESKKLVMLVAMSGEINTMGHHLSTMAERNRLTRDFTLNSLTRAIREVIACFPVYRSYIDNRGVREEDSRYIEMALTKARRRNPALGAAAFDFLQNVLLLRYPPHADQAEQQEWLHFVMRFQQITGPVMAKGVEDTTFYRYHRLVSLNEVGGMPERFGTTLENFHAQNLERARCAPCGMITTATHDSKHGADFRARIDVLSEVPEKWQKALAVWSRINRGKKLVVDGQLVPDRNEEYLIYQTLLGAWPQGEELLGEAFRKRIISYLVKALREAKVNSSWIRPNLPYEEALQRFVEAILEEDPRHPFLSEFLPLQRLVAHCGIFNSLSQTILKMTSPGVPDFYQGTELWDLTVVDPDNRGTVDYALRWSILQELIDQEKRHGPGAVVKEILQSRQDGRVKLYLIYRVLSFRKERRELLERGEYLPLAASGRWSRQLCAFGRRLGDVWGVVAVPRLVSALVPEPGGMPTGECWEDTVITLPAEGALHYRNVITGDRIAAAREQGSPVLQVAKLFADAPFALLEGTAP